MVDMAVTGFIVVAVVTFMTMFAYCVKTSDRRVDQLEREKEQTFLEYTLRG